MKFNRMTFNNFKSFKGKHTFDFLGGVPGLYFIKGETGTTLGSNGAGKSSFISDAPFWCIFGKTPRSLKAANVHTWGVKGSTDVKLEITTSTGDYTIYRSWSPNKLQLTVNGETKEVTQAEIDAVINLTETEFLNSVMFGQFNDTFLDLQPAQMMELFSASLDLEVWTAKSAVANKKLTEVNNAILKVENDIQFLNGRLSTIDSNIVLAKQSAVEFEVNRLTKINTLKQRITELEVEKEKLLQEKSTISVVITEVPIQLQNDKNVIKSELHSTEILINSVQSTCRNIENDINSAHTEIKIKERELEKTQSMGDNCAYCGQPITEEHFLKEQERIIAEIEVIEGKLSEFDDTLSVNTNTLNKLLAQYNEIKIKETSINNQIYSELHKNDDTKRLLQNNERMLSTNMQSLSYARKELDKEINTINTSETLVESYKNDKLQSANKLKAFNTNLDKLNQDKSAYETWVKGFKEIRLLIIEEAITELEVEVNNSLVELGLDGWNIKFDVERENKSGGLSKGFVVQIYSPLNKEPVPLAAWSGGEGQRLRIAAVSGLANLITNRKGVFPNIEIWDEPTKGLSGEGIDYLLSFLSNRAKVLNKQVYLIDHNSLDSGEFDRTVTISKNGNGSKII